MSRRVTLTMATKDFIVRRQRGAPVIEHARFIAWALTEKPRSESVMTSSGHLPLGQSRLPRVLLVYVGGERTTVLEELSGYFRVSSVVGEGVMKGL
ncbi:hypothetical protein K443DRAFT_601836 [Laccaria amethystina LaAM-08-1]|uniref:Uncharacterized protein n=1 Tax=Laccaria amethystina LaAM-08-1 TaxID=1095629 RepID=A0A0C9XG43_9AGAR|nr:hypothetical protein K443DRAFT_601836 [Laccaria amethystina LaAM-08-1]